jgi:hypothetical protein
VQAGERQAERGTDERAASPISSGLHIAQKRPSTAPEASSTA